jgi:branched-chain amino acid transport system permease protein
MQWVLDGIPEGLLLGALGLAFMLVYNSTGVFFIALAGVYSLAPFVAASLAASGVPLMAACAGGVAASAALSVTMELVNHGPLDRRSASWAGHLVTSIGWNLVVVQMLAVIWGNKLEGLGRNSVGPASFGGVFLSSAQEIEILVAALAVSLTFLLLWKTGFGVEIRGMASNRTAFELAAHNPQPIRIGVFALGGAIAACVSLARAADSGFNAFSGLGPVVLSFAALVVGGKNELWGPVVGGLLIGLLRSAVTWYGSARWQEPASFAFLALFLLLRPHGLLGHSRRLEARL